jgi:uncharacterized damage-inducible protein DinB
MNNAGLLLECFGRVRTVVHHAVLNLSEDQLAARLGERANSIAWLVWHLTRIQDNHVADAAGTDEVWTSTGWADRFGLPFDPAATGYGQTAHEAAQVRAPGALLIGYHDAVTDQTLRFVRSLRDTTLDRIVDESWDPPVSLGVRLVSVISDDLQHAGQAAYARGLITG